MRWIGLTGGIASGKSTVAAILRSRGFSVVDADELARRAVTKDSVGLKSIVKKFGSEILTKDGEMNRTLVGQKVFADKKALLDLENIVHPIVRDLAEEERQKLKKQNAEIAFYDVPLLFEKKMEKNFDAILLVVAEESHQVERIKKRDSLSEEEIFRRLGAQIPLKDKINKADFIIHNTGSLDDLSVQTEIFLKSVGVTHHKNKPDGRKG